MVRDNRKETSTPLPSITNTTTTRNVLFFIVPALSATMTASSGPSSASITSSITFTCCVHFLTIVEGLAAEKDGMLDGVNDVIKLDIMDCILILVFPTEQFARKAHVPTS